jgi:hypothetical protein
VEAALAERALTERREHYVAEVRGSSTPRSS